MKNRLLYILVTIFLLIIPSINLSAQDNVSGGGGQNVFDDTVFNELTLTDEGITAVDTFGNDWYYDFETSQFVYGGAPDNAERTFFEDGSSRSELPVEERCTEVRKVPAIVNSITIGEDEYVKGNINAYDRVTIKGWVMGSIKSVKGRVLVTETGQVDGDVEAPRIIVKEGGEVLGRQIISDSPIDLDYLKSTFTIDGVVVISIITIFFLIVGFLILTLMPRQFANFSVCMEKNKFKTTFLGFILFISMPLVIGLVVITLIGIPLVPFIPILYVIASIMGIFAVGNRIGAYIYKKIAGKESNTVLQSITGTLVLMLFWFLSMIFFGISESYGDAFGGIFLAAAIIVIFYPFFGGVGAAILTRFGFRIYVSFFERRGYEKNVKTPAPPPIPEPPSNNIKNKNNFTPPFSPKPPSSDRDSQNPD